MWNSFFGFFEVRIKVNGTNCINDEQNYPLYCGDLY